MSAAREQHMDTIRKAAFPTPSPFGVEWEKQRATEAHTLFHRWAQGRTENKAGQRMEPIWGLETGTGTGNRDAGTGNRYAASY